MNPSLFCLVVRSNVGAEQNGRGGIPPKCLTAHPPRDYSRFYLNQKTCRGNRPYSPDRSKDLYVHPRLISENMPHSPATLVCQHCAYTWEDDHYSRFHYFISFLVYPINHNSSQSKLGRMHAAAMDQRARSNTQRHFQHTAPDDIYLRQPRNPKPTPKRPL